MLPRITDCHRRSLATFLLMLAAGVGLCAAQAPVAKSATSGPQTARSELVIHGHKDNVDSVAFSPDGRWLASGSGDTTIKLWEVTTGAEVRTFGSPDNDVVRSVNSVAFSPDGHWIASGSNNGVELWEVATGAKVRTIGHGDPGATSVAFSPDGRWLAVGNLANTIKLWEVATGAEVRTFGQREWVDYVSEVAFSPDGRWLASGVTDNTIKLWDVATGSKVRTFAGHKSYHDPKQSVDRVDSVAFSPDGRWLASCGSSDKTIQLWDVATGGEVRTFAGHKYDVESVTFSPDGRWLASGSKDNTIKLWEVATGSPVRTFVGHTNGVLSVAFSPDGRWLASGGRDKTVRLWRTEPSQVGSSASPGGSEKGLIVIRLPSPAGHEAKAPEPVILGSHDKSIFILAFSEDGNSLASVTVQDNHIKVWDLRRRKEKGSLNFGALARLFKFDEEAWNSVALSADGKQLAGGWGQDVRIWDVDRKEQTANLEGQGGAFTVEMNSQGTEAYGVRGHSDEVRAVAFSPNGRWLASGGEDGEVKVWPVGSGRPVHNPEASETVDAGVWALAFSPDGRWLASGDRGGTLRIRDFGSHVGARNLESRGPISVLAFSPNGSLLASAGADQADKEDQADQKVRLWDTANWQEKGTVTGFGDKVCSLAFSSDGRFLATATRNAFVQVLDLNTMKAVYSVKAGTSVYLHRDGRLLSAGHDGEKIQLWEIRDWKGAASQ